MFAEIHHKIPVIEDVLTSNVFGCYKYLPFESGLGPLLKKAKRLGCEGKKKRSEELNRIIDKTRAFKIKFWPRMDDRSEPDAIILLQDKCENDICVLGIEAKHGSGMGTYAAGESNGDELKDELKAQEKEDKEGRETIKQTTKELRNIKRRETSFLNGVSHNIPSFILYITHHVTCPHDALESNDVLWASWRYAYMAAKPEGNQNGYFEEILRDLRSLLKEVGYASFEGWGDECKTMNTPEWEYPLKTVSLRFQGWQDIKNDFSNDKWQYSQLH